MAFRKLKRRRGLREIESYPARLRVSFVLAIPKWGCLPSICAKPVSFPFANFSPFPFLYPLEAWSHCWWTCNSRRLHVSRKVKLLGASWYMLEMVEFSRVQWHLYYLWYLCLCRCSNINIGWLALLPKWFWWRVISVLCGLMLEERCNSTL